jgi:hypothetical protein
MNIAIKKAEEKYVTIMMKTNKSQLDEKIMHR